MANRRFRKPRSRSMYDNTTMSRPNMNKPPDDQTIRDTIAPTQLVRPKYNDGPMHFRPWPALDPTQPDDNLLPGRMSVNPKGQNEWIVKVDVARYIGIKDDVCEPVTFCLYEPWMRREKSRSNPYRVFYRACSNAFENGRFSSNKKWDSDWNSLMKGKKGQGEAISKPKNVAFMQGILYYNARTDYSTYRDEGLPLGMAENDDLVVVQVAGKVMDKMLDLLDREKDNVPSDVDPETQPWKYFYYGDPTGIYNPQSGRVEGGVITTVFNPDVNKEFTKHTSWDLNQKRDFGGYEVALRPQYKDEDGRVFKPSLDPDQTQRVFDKSQMWFPNPDDPENDPGLIYFPSVEEQCLYIAKAFQTVPDLVRAAWADHEDEFITDDVKAVLNKRRSEVVPGEDDDEAPRSRRTKQDPMTQAQSQGEETFDEPDFGEENESEPEPVGDGGDEGFGEEPEFEGEAGSGEEPDGFGEEPEGFGEEGESEPEPETDGGEEPEGFGEDSEPDPDAGQEDPTAFPDDVEENTSSSSSGQSTGDDEPGEWDPSEEESQGQAEQQMDQSVQAAQSRGSKRSSKPPQSGKKTSKKMGAKRSQSKS